MKKLRVIGTSPTISDGDLVLPETGAIIDYILDRHPFASLQPEPGSPQRNRPASQQALEKNGPFTPLAE
ncbi:hypothetical protein [Aliiroseovarius sp.]|uniref:hypothetical protein n=1 Tax=Aliiroseovarius sp. TaxID=1872442 RepID=UPI003BA9F025